MPSRHRGGRILAGGDGQDGHLRHHPLRPEPVPRPWSIAPLLLDPGVIGILYGAVVACVTPDMKRLVAYSSLSHIGFIVLGTFALTTQGSPGLCCRWSTTGSSSLCSSS